MVMEEWTEKYRPQKLDNILGNDKAVAELRACLSDNVTTPDAVAKAAVEYWIDDPNLRQMLLGNAERIDFSFECGCPPERGVILVAILLQRVMVLRAIVGKIIYPIIVGVITGIPDIIVVIVFLKWVEDLQAIVTNVTETVNIVIFLK